MTPEQLMQQALRRQQAAAWESGFRAGQQYGAAQQRHDPQWDREGEPTRPENPYSWGDRHA